MTTTEKINPASREAEEGRLSIPRKEPSEKIQAYYRAGQRAVAEGCDVGSEAFWKMVVHEKYMDREVNLKEMMRHDWIIAHTFFQAGVDGDPMPTWVTGWRYGHQIPVDSDAYPKRPLSMMHVDGAENIEMCDYGFEKIEASGWLVGPTETKRLLPGILADVTERYNGELLIVAAKEIK